MNIFFILLVKNDETKVIEMLLKIMNVITDLIIAEKIDPSSLNDIIGKLLL